jgi:hypothetical protein
MFLTVTFHNGTAITYIHYTVIPRECRDDLVSGISSSSREDSRETFIAGKLETTTDLTGLKHVKQGVTEGEHVVRILRLISHKRCERHGLRHNEVLDESVRETLSEFRTRAVKQGNVGKRCTCKEIRRSRAVRSGIDGNTGRVTCE